jgi:hypothetical protein
MIDMPNSLRARLKKCVHKGVLDEKDIDRLVVLPPHVSLDTSYEEAYKLGYAAAMKEVKAIVFNRYSLVENSYEDVCALVRRWENDR